jgi:hypothetical protein
MASPLFPQIEAPTFESAGTLSQNATNNLAKGFGIFGDIATRIKQQNIDRQNKEFLPKILGVNTAEEAEYLLNNLNKEIDPSVLNNANMSNLLNLRSNVNQQIQFEQGQESRDKAKAREATLRKIAINQAKALSNNSEEVVTSDNIFEDTLGKFVTPNNSSIITEELPTQNEEFVATIQNSLDNNPITTVKQSLGVTESTNNPKASYTDSEGDSYVGKYQFGEDRLQEAKNAGVVPKNMTQEQFRNSEESFQEEVMDWHLNDHNQNIDNNGLDQYIGKTINGDVITREGMLAMAHLGGFTGMKNYLESNGKKNPKDEVGTKLSDYNRKHSPTSVPVTSENNDTTTNNSSNFNTDLSQNTYNPLDGLTDEQLNALSNEDINALTQQATFAQNQNLIKQLINTSGSVAEYKANVAGLNLPPARMIALNDFIDKNADIFKAGLTESDINNEVTLRNDFSQRASLAIQNNLANQEENNVLYRVSNAYANIENPDASEAEVARKLLETYGSEVASNLNEMLKDVSRVRTRAKLLGVDISPAKAGILMEEAMKGYWPDAVEPFGDSIAIKEDTVAELAKIIESSSGQRAINDFENYKKRFNERVPVLEERIREITTTLLIKQNRGQSTEKEEKELKEIEKEYSEFLNTIPNVDKPKIKTSTVEENNIEENKLIKDLLNVRDWIKG